ncbi:MAG: universal stress protein [Dysgonamonadaceae bacterium]|jgi:nucleotide-binding universal stress UspA family protein|nr:universal stress protein [Dysgonamonadaceae bacterium]
MEDKLITLAIHTFQKAQLLKTLLESEGIEVYLHNVNLIQPVVSSGVRVRIKESDLPAALKIIETTNLFEEEQPNKTSTPLSKTILIPVDFSQYSKHACEIGFNYAARVHSEIIIMHAYFTPYFPSTISLNDTFSYQTHDEATISKLTEKAKKDLEEFSEFIRNQINFGHWPDVKFTTILRDGLPEEEITACSNEYKPLMIIMGTRGKNQKDADLIGSVTAEVIEMAKFPVFAIPENTPFRNFSEIKQVAFGTSFEQKDLIAVDTLFKMFSGYTIEYHLFHISNRQDAWHEIKLAGIKEYFEKQYPEIIIRYEVIDSNDFVLNLEKFIRKNSIDFISLATHRRNLLARIINPSMARKMLFHTDTPILALRS